MKPIMQTVFGRGKGNCFNACLAAIFEVDIESLPYLMKEKVWFADYDKYVQERFDSAMTMFYFNKGIDFAQLPDGYCIVSGKSPRGDFLHATVGYIYNDTVSILHDPHPDGTNIESINDVIIFEEQSLYGY